MFSSNASQVSDSATYIEDIFSCFLYTGNGSTQTITNGIDLAGEGGLVWLKNRSSAIEHKVFDTARGMTYTSAKELVTNLTDPESNRTNLIRADATGFSLGSASNFGAYNQSGQTYASWTFRKQEKFFDVVTYTGNGVAGRTVAHNLGSVPGCIIIKQLNDVTNWITYHRANTANPETDYLQLNSTAATIDLDNVWNDTAPTSTEFTLGTNNDVNKNGGSYVAYLFAHNAGGFGLSGEDNVISCGSFLTDPSTGGATVNLGYEPQFLLVKSATSVQGWHLIDNMRGMANSGGYGTAASLEPNSSNAESVGANCFPTANGFWYARSGNTTYIYIAIRRGPMKVPESGTSVFTPVARTGTGTAVTVTGFQGPLDSLFVANRTDSTDKFLIANRLTAERYTLTSSTAAETVSVTAAFPVGVFGVMNGFNLPATTSNVTNKSATTYINYGFTRAPGFMDVCCYTGTGVARTVAHNLGVAPELMIVKNRSGTVAWSVYDQFNGPTMLLQLNASALSQASAVPWNNTAPTASVFTVGTGTPAFTNASGSNYVAYLFATCPGVSKVFNFTGNGSSQTINCGFTGGARFVMIKRTDSTGDWYVWDSARGIVSGNDPRLSLNTTAAEVTTDDSVDTDSTGFVVNQLSATNVNVNGASYIGLAIA